MIFIRRKIGEYSRPITGYREKYKKERKRTSISLDFHNDTGLVCSTYLILSFIQGVLHTPNTAHIHTRNGVCPYTCDYSVLM